MMQTEALRNVGYIVCINAANHYYTTFSRRENETPGNTGL
jgi:hypothetical protein